MITCYFPSLSALPLIRLPGVRTLALSNQNVTLLEVECFVARDLTHEEELFVLCSGMRTIKVGPFNRLTKMTRLSIVGNEIRDKIPGTFEIMNNLVCLRLFKIPT